MYTINDITIKNTYATVAQAARTVFSCSFSNLSPSTRDSLRSVCEMPVSCSSKTSKTSSRSKASSRRKANAEDTLPLESLPLISTETALAKCAVLDDKLVKLKVKLSKKIRDQYAIAAARAKLQRKIADVVRLRAKIALKHLATAKAGVQG